MTPYRHFNRQSHTRARGRSAEDDAVRWLSLQGLRIVDRNVQFKAGELDVVAIDGDTLCFIEVKARATARYGAAIYAVTERKQRQVAAAAGLYLATHEHDGPCRFDVLAMDGSARGWRYTYVKDAFELD